MYCFALEAKVVRKGAKRKAKGVGGGGERFTVYGVRYGGKKAQRFGENDAGMV